MNLAPGSWSSIAVPAVLGELVRSASDSPLEAVVDIADTAVGSDADGIRYERSRSITMLRLCNSQRRSASATAF